MVSFARAVAVAASIMSVCVFNLTARAHTERQNAIHGQRETRNWKQIALFKWVARRSFIIIVLMKITKIEMRYDGRPVLWCMRSTLWRMPTSTFNICVRYLFSARARCAGDVMRHIFLFSSLSFFFISDENDDAHSDGWTKSLGDFYLGFGMWCVFTKCV